MDIKELIVILPTIGAILALTIKLMSNFLKMLVKSTYKDVPGEDSILPIISKVVFSFIVVVVVLIITTIILAIINGKMRYLLNIENETFFTNMFYKFVVISNIALPIITVILVIQYINLFKLNLISYHPISEKLITYNNICAWVSGFYLIIVIICILDYIEKGIFKGNNNTNTLIIYGIYLLTIFLINYNLKKENKELENRKNVYIHLQNETIVCRGYLDFTEYYLIAEDKKDKFIKKSEVKYIIKEKK